MLKLFSQRRTIRHFTSQPIPREQVEQLLLAGFLAPSSMGKKPVEFVVVDDIDRIRDLKNCKEHGTMAFATATLAIVVIADSSLSDVWVEDAALAAIYIQLEAENLGLGSTWVQMRRRKGSRGDSEAAVRQAFHIPEKYGVLAIIALGNKAESPQPATPALPTTKVHYGSFA